MNNMQYDISVVVPIYNVEEFLGRCVDSLFQETKYSIQIILVNDGSTDRSREIVQHYKDKFENVYLVDKTNGGLSDARNAGLKVAIGRYVLFVDSDDYVSIGLFDRLGELFETDADCVVFQHCVNGNSNAVKLPLNEDVVYTGEKLLYELFRSEKTFAPVWKYMYKLDFLRKNDLQFVKGLIHEDEVWTPITLLKARKCYFCDFIGYHYEIRAGSIMTTPSISKISSYILVAVELDKQLRNMSIEDVELKKIISRHLAGLYTMSGRILVKNHFKEAYSLLWENYWLKKYCTSGKQRLAFLYLCLRSKFLI